MPVQEPGTRPHRPTSYRLHADVTADRTTSQVTAALTNAVPLGGAVSNIGVDIEGAPAERGEDRTARYTVVSSENRFASAALDTGDKFSFRFKEAGAYPYYCSVHPMMTGKVMVH